MGNPMTDRIAALIEKMLAENGGELELQRNKLAGSVGCAPSQINYVITSRFGSQRGYIVESRRGGGGAKTDGDFIQSQIQRDSHAVMSVVNAVFRSRQAAKHDVDRIAVAESVFFDAAGDSVVFRVAFGARHAAGRFCERIGVFARFKSAFDF